MENEIDYKALSKDAIDLCDTMLKELYYAKINDLLYDQLDVAIFKLKAKFNGGDE